MSIEHSLIIISSLDSEYTLDPLGLIRWIDTPSGTTRENRIRGIDYVMPPTRKGSTPQSAPIAAYVVYGRFVVSQGLTNR